MYMSKFKTFMQKNKCEKKKINNTFNDANNIMITTIFFFITQLCWVISLFLFSRLNINIYFFN